MATPNVPIRAFKLLSLAAGPRRREKVLYEVETSYRKSAKRFDERFARKQFWIDTIFALPGLLVARFGGAIVLSVAIWLRQHLGL